MRKQVPEKEKEVAATPAHMASTECIIYRHYTHAHKFFLPLALRRAKTFNPSFVAARAKKPCLRFLLIREG
jgi:hypothetical protein